MYPRIIIIIDGIDECPMMQRSELLKFITALPYRVYNSVLAISRKEVDIEDEFASEHFPTISLEDERINLKDDMHYVIREEFQDTRRWGRTFQMMQDEITESLILGSGKNMFRWLQCQLALLNRVKTPKAIREALQKLPTTLFETYDRMFEYIDDEDHDSVELVRKALFLIVHVARPLRLGELVEALAVNGDIQLDWSSTFGDPKDLLRACNSLVYLGIPEGTHGHSPMDTHPVDSIEYLVSDYLRSHPTLSHYVVEKKGDPKAQWRLVALTLSYLLLDDFSVPCVSPRLVDKRARTFRFYTYCAQYWFSHIKLIGDEPLEENLFELIERFICGSPSHLRSYEEMMDYSYYDTTDKKAKAKKLNLSRNDIKWPVSNALFYHIIAKGLGWIANEFLRTDLVWVAILTGNESMAEKILALGAHIQQQCSPHELFVSKPYIVPESNYPENDDPFDILLHGDGAAPIHYATLGNNLDGVRAPVAAGADVNAQTNAGMFPFHIAVSLQSALIAEYLLECGATIPLDITEEELQWIDSKIAPSLKYYLPADELNARLRLHEICFP
ncbi:hypothetical protein BDD12DRAFT_981933, partial [Trichophaea hybrida]